jgi:hypothetical protein
MNRQRLLALVAAVIAVVAIGLWVLWPSDEKQATSAATAGPYLVSLTGDPPKIGVDVLTVAVTGDGVQPPPDSVTFEPAMPQMGHAAKPVVANEESIGHYRAAVDLSMAGQWEVTVRIASGEEIYQAVLNVTTTG